MNKTKKAFPYTRCESADSLRLNQLRGSVVAIEARDEMGNVLVQAIGSVLLLLHVRPRPGRRQQPIAILHHHVISGIGCKCLQIHTLLGHPLSESFLQKLLFIYYV